MNMPALSLPSDRRHQRGQVLPLTLLMMVALIGITGLAVDVSSALQTQRFERAVTDAASLAGAQDLQPAGTRKDPQPIDKQHARTHAMQVVVDHLGASSMPDTSCDTEGATGCTAGSGLACLTPAGCKLPGTLYWASIRTPSPTCIDCFGRQQLAVQVSVWNPSFGLTFARLLGQSIWKVGAASVAAVDHARAYGVVTLRPPQPRCIPPTCLTGDNNQDDFKIGGGSILNITGDIGTNTNIVYDGSVSSINLSSPDCAPTCDYKAFHYDAYQQWSGLPPGVQITTPIKDPMYLSPPLYLPPTRPTDPLKIYSARDLSDAQDLLGCDAVKKTVPPEYKISAGTSIRDLVANSTVLCFKPGIYQQELNNSTKTVAYLLEPGVYFFDKGLNNGSTTVGGFVGDGDGVALVFPECSTGANCPLSGQNSDLLALNFGSAYKASGTRAKPAKDVDGKLVQTPGDLPVPITIMVTRDPLCYVPDTTPASDPTSCKENQNNTINLAGGGELYLAGVLYAPTDHVTIGGGSVTTGIVGEVISWTVKYASSQLTLESAVVEKAGVLRLDRACSPGEICNP